MSSNVFDIAPHEPRLDDFVSALAGEPREDLSGFGREQPYRTRGLVLSQEAVEVLSSLTGRGRLGRFELRGHRDAVAELAAAGLLTEDGQVTPVGGEYLRPWNHPVATLSLTAEKAAHPSGLQAWLGGGLALVSAGPSVPAPDGRVLPGTTELDLVALSALAYRIASWAGIAPAWSVVHESLDLDAGLFAARLQSAAVPAPAGLDPAGVRLWEQEWYGWNIQHLESGTAYNWVNAGPAGHYRAAPGAEGRVVLQAEPSSAVWDHVVRLIHAAVTGVEPDPGVDARFQAK